MSDWDRDQFLRAPITSRANAGWVGWKPSRYRAVLRNSSYNLADKGYSWKNTLDILKAGLRGGLGKGSPVYEAVTKPINSLKQLPQDIRKLQMGTPTYSTPPPAVKKKQG